MEIYAHDLSVTPDEDEPEILCISGKDWENQPFKLFLRPEDVQLVLLQLGFYVS